jgi:hypothetical protein
MKTQYAVGVGETLNIFISCLNSSSPFGTVYGIGTFPWDAVATNATGGLWLNSHTVTTDSQLVSVLLPSPFS